MFGTFSESKTLKNMTRLKLAKPEKSNFLKTSFEFRVGI